VLPQQPYCADVATAGYLTPALERWRRWTDGPLIVLAIGTLPILLLELERDELPRGDRVLIDTVNVVVLVAFAVDYFVEVALARRRSEFVRREWASLLIVLAQAIAIAPGLGAVGVLRGLRGVRGLRALLVAVRLLAVGGAVAGQGRAYLRREAASLALGIAGLTWLTAAVAFTLAEDVGVDGRVGSFFDALWWSTTTITTVGYGDVYPVTGTGRVVGGLTMFVGISAFAVVTAKVAEFLVRTPAVEAEPTTRLEN
jgi:voltage-gated potassium channel